MMNKARRKYIIDIPFSDSKQRSKFVKDLNVSSIIYFS